MNDTFFHLYTTQAKCVEPSPIREICRFVDLPEIKSLAGGWPDPSVFPCKEIAEILNELLATQANRVLQYGSTEGLPALRNELATWAKQEEGISCSADEIIVTHGSQQAMDLASRVLIEPNDIVMVELPTYFGGTGVIKSRGGLTVGVPVDDSGIDTSQLAHELAQLSRMGKRVKGIYVIPNHQNPTGVTLSLERRRRLIELAEIYNLIIFEDDPYGDIRFEGGKLPSLKALDRSGRVIHMHSLSKTFAPGMRLAWTVGETKIVRKMVIAKQFVDCCTNTLAQYIALEFFRRGFFRERIALNISYYKKKRDFMLEQLDRHFPEEVQWNRPTGGFFVFVYLPEYLDANDLLIEATAQNVVFVPGAPFFVDGSGRNTFRLSYSQVDEVVIQAAVTKLGCIIKEHLISY